MALTNQSGMSLRIHGDELVPTKISQTLGADPSYSHAKGDELCNPGSMNSAAPSGIWILAVSDESSKNLDDQVRDLLSVLSDDLKLWGDLTDTFSAGLYAAVQINEADTRIKLAPETVRKIADRGLEIGFRICNDSKGEFE